MQNGAGESIEEGRVYRVIVGHLNLEVIAGDIVVTPRPISGDDNGIVARGQFNFWSA